MSKQALKDSPSAQQVLKEAAKLTQDREKVLDKLVEGWSKTKSGRKLDVLWEKNKNKARVAAMSLQNQKRYWAKNQFTESTIKSSFLFAPEKVLRMVRIGSANRNRGQMFTEWAMISPTDSVYFIDRVYSTPDAGAVATGADKQGVAGDRIYDRIASLHATEQYEVSSNLSNVNTATGTLSPGPVIKLWVTVVFAGKVLGRDDGNGKFTAIGPELNTSTSVIDYTTGNYTLNFTSNLTGELRIVFAFDSEVATNYKEWGMIDIKVDRKIINARQQPLGYQYSRLAAELMSATGLGNIEDLLVNGIGDEHAMRKDFRSIVMANRLSNTNTVSTFSRNFAAEGEATDFDHAQKILSKISDMSGDLFNEIGRGELNKIICGTEMATYLRKNRLWVSDNSQPRTGGCYLAGRLDGIETYVTREHTGTPGLPAKNEAVLTWKNPQEEGDVALVFGTYTEFTASLDYPEFYRKGNIASVEGEAVMQSKYLRKLVLTP